MARIVVSARAREPFFSGLSEKLWQRSGGEQRSVSISRSTSVNAARQVVEQQTDFLLATL